MREQKFLSISASTKSTLIKWAKRQGWKYSVKELSKNCYDVIIYCSSEALEIP